VIKNFRRFSSLTLLCTVLYILAGAPVSAQPASGPNNRVIYPDVRVCVTKKDASSCYRVPYNDPALISLIQRHKPEVKEIYIPLLSDAYESGILFWVSLVFLLLASSGTAAWMILNWKKIRPTNPH
jgi:hypothetical protein